MDLSVREAMDKLGEESDAARQYGVVAWKEGPDGAALILLITSRETKRWVVPRGNPMPGLTGAESAAQEAWEEAGIRGAIAERPIGTYRYDKLRRWGRSVPTAVSLYAMHVEEEHPIWPEREQRERRWFTSEAAAGAVEEPELQSLLAAFRPPRLS